MLEVQFLRFQEKCKVLSGMMLKAPNPVHLDCSTFGLFNFG